VPRATAIYKHLNRASLAPTLLRFGVDRSLSFEVLAAARNERERAETWPLVDDEIEALEAMDIPYFSAAASSTDLVAGGGRVVKDYFPESAIAAAERRLRAFDEADRTRQTKTIEGAFAASAARLGSGATAVEHGGDTNVPAPSNFVAEANE